jgi:hypothetical protein
MEDPGSEQNPDRGYSRLRPDRNGYCSRPYYLQARTVRARSLRFGSHTSPHLMIGVSRKTTIVFSGELRLLVAR